MNRVVVQYVTHYVSFVGLVHRSSVIFSHDLLAEYLNCPNRSRSLVHSLSIVILSFQSLIQPLLHGVDGAFARVTHITQSILIEKTRPASRKIMHISRTLKHHRSTCTVTTLSSMQRSSLHVHFSFHPDPGYVKPSQCTVPIP